jgi:hypothetical protein
MFMLAGDQKSAAAINTVETHETFCLPRGKGREKGQKREAATVERSTNRGRVRFVAMSHNLLLRNSVKAPHGRFAIALYHQRA